MKKFLAVFAIAATMVACNDSAESSTTKDSASNTTTVDPNTTTTVTQVPGDSNTNANTTTVTRDTISVAPAGDTTKRK